MRTDLQARCYPLDVVYGDVAFASLDAAEIRSVHLNVVGKVLLTNASFLAVEANVSGKNLS